MLATVLSSRTVARTAMNQQSSRSHAVLTLHIEQELDSSNPNPNPDSLRPNP